METPSSNRRNGADEDALRAFVAGRNERRNITIGQKAMGYTMLFPDPEQGGRGKKLLPKSKSLGVGSEGYAAKLVSQARAVIRHTPELAEKVRDGFPLNEASPFGFDLQVIAAKFVLHVNPKPGRVRRSLFDRRHDRLALSDQRPSKLDVGAKKIAPIDRAHGVSHVVGLGLRAAQNVIDVDLQPQGFVAGQFAPFPF
jgi:hypothetical protein